MLSRWRTAPDGSAVPGSVYLESVRAAAGDAAWLDRVAGRMRSREGVHGGSMRPARQGVSDPTAATDDRIDWEDAHARQAAMDADAVEDCGRLLYGDGSGGGMMALSRGAATVVELRCMRALPWRKVVESMVMSERWCREQLAVAADLIDSLGYDAVERGDGGAMDA